jgi:hypothetical protein
MREYSGFAALIDVVQGQSAGNGSTRPLRVPDISSNVTLNEA